jgi:CRISPR/Cas system-associated endonuclease Cas1
MDSARGRRSVRLRASGRGFRRHCERARVRQAAPGAAIREKQWRAFLDRRKRLDVARCIVAAKLRTLRLDPADARDFRAELDKARKLEDILTTEARAGAAWWQRWRGFPLVGFLHSTKPGRASLAYDALELHRADLTEATFRYAAKCRFRPDDFETERDGVVRLSSKIARDMAALALRVAGRV